MSKGNRHWLAGELPELLSQGVINQDTCERLSNHFELDKIKAEPQGFSKMSIILAAIGGLLIGGGIIMILAHNWDQMGRGMRMLLALLPLISSQIFALLALFPNERGMAWREAAAAFMFCAVPASIAVVGQTYHISNDFQSFQTLWFILVLPFIYLLRAKLAATMAMMLAAWMAGLHQGDYWLCAAALLPFHFLAEPYGRGKTSTKIAWIFALGISFSIFMSRIESVYSQNATVLVFMSGAVSLYFLGGLTEKVNGFWQRPFSNIGAIGIALNLLVYTFVDTWKINKTDIGLTFYHVIFSEFLLISFAFIGLAWACITKRIDLLPLGGMLLLSLIFVAIPIDSWQPGAFAFTANIIALSLGVWYLWLGIGDNSASRMNFGLVLIMSLILMRFFDQDFSFIVKGVAFIVMGCAFIGVNLWHNRSTVSQRSAV